MPPALRCPQCDTPAASDGPARYECPKCRHRWSPSVGGTRLDARALAERTEQHLERFERQAQNALDLAIEFRDVEIAGGADVLARRLEEARRIREKRKEGEPR